MSVALNPNPSYLIQTGKPDLPRASAMNKIFDADSLQLFPYKRIKEGDKVLFAACGNGVLMIEILKRIQVTNVSVVAIDSSEKQLECAKNLAESQGFLGIKWKQHSLNDLSELKDQFNLVHSRFVLNHLQKPKEAVKELCGTLTQGGVFVSEEVGGLDLYIESESLEQTEAIRSWELMVAIQHHKQKSDICFGKKMQKTHKKIQMHPLEEVIISAKASTREQKELFVSSAL